MPLENLLKEVKEKDGGAIDYGFRGGHERSSAARISRLTFL